jgi:hypothetical protein
MMNCRPHEWGQIIIADHKSKGKGISTNHKTRSKHEIVDNKNRDKGILAGHKSGGRHEIADHKSGEARVWYLTPGMEG